jgi:hypothetical protein
MKKNKKRKERMAAANAIANPSVTANEHYDRLGRPLKRQRDEDDFVNGNRNKATGVNSSKKKTKENHEAAGKQHGQPPSHKSPGKTPKQKHPEKVVNSKASNASFNGPAKVKETAKLDLAALFSSPDRLLPGPKRTAITQSYATSKPF